MFDLSQSEYRNAPGLSRSDLMLMDKTPAHYMYSKSNPQEATPAMIEGSALHALILEPDTFEGSYAVMPESIKMKGTNKYDTWIAEERLEMHTILSKRQWDMIEGMFLAVNEAKKAKLYLNGHHEKCFFWNDPDTGILLKCRPDSIHLKAGVIADLKSTTSAHPKDFMKKVHDLSYHVQAAFYIDGVIEAIKQGGKGDFEFKNPDSFMFIAVEKEPPHCIGYYDLSPSFIDEGRKIYKMLVKKYNESFKSDNWHGYSDKVIRLNEKSYMYR